MLEFVARSLGFRLFEPYISLLIYKHHKNREHMKISRILLTLLLVAQAHANIIFVTPNGSGNYFTIQSAYNASAAGDTILIGPGTYNETVSNMSRRLHIIGAGFDVTSTTRITFNSNGSRSTIEGMKFSQGSNDAVSFGSSDSVTVRRCMLTNSNIWVLMFGPTNGRLYVDDCIFLRTYTAGSGLDLVNVSSGGRTYFRNCLFASYLAASNHNAVDGSTIRTEFHNCTFLGFNDVFNMNCSEPSVFINNLFADWGTASWGTVHPGSVWDYNGSTSIAPPGTHSIVLPGNPFVNYSDVLNFNYGTSDLRIVPASPAYNGGHPDILDLDGSVSDLGIYGGSTPMVDTGAPAYPFAISVATTPATALVGTNVDLNSVGRVGPQY